MTLEIQEEKVQLSVHDKMYQGLDESKHRVFPVHRVLSDAVKKEWKDPERGPFFFFQRLSKEGSPLKIRRQS